MKRIALGKERGDFYVQFGDGTSHGRMHRSARNALNSFESSSDVAIDLGEGNEFVVLGRRRHLLHSKTSGNFRAIVGKKRKFDEMVELECNGCSCQREPGLVVCRDCGEATPGRVRMVCSQHPLAIHSTDVFACR